MDRMTLGELEVLIRHKRKSEQADPLRQKRDKLMKVVAKLQRKIDKILGDHSAAVPAVSRPRPRRKLTEAARRRIGQAQKAR
jgi:hypothetical protein